MANKEFHELITAEELSASDIIAEQRENSGTWLSRKLTFNALGLFLLNQLDYATELHTTSKNVFGAINELKDGVSAVTIGTTAPSDSLGDNRNLYIQYDGTDYSVVAMYVKIEDSWRPIELGGGGGGSYVELTQAEYDALEQAGELEEDTPYFITDVNGDGSQFQPVIYSTAEREIGVWTDGKPLYEKSFSLTSPEANVSTNIVDVTELDIDTLVSLEGNINSASNSIATGNSEWRLWLRKNFESTLKDYIACFVTFAGYASQPCVITIHYTKSTDTAGSGTWTPQGVPAVHYSSDEKIVGTWIDGSPIYEKTYIIEGEFELQVSNTSWTSTGIAISDISKIIGVEIMGDSNYQGSALATIQNGVLNVQTTRNSIAYARYIVLNYIKAST